MKSFPFLITFSIVVSIVHCQQPSTVPGLIQSAALNAPVNVLRIRQPTTVNERSSSPSQPIRRAPISSPISSNLLDEETRDNYVSCFLSSSFSLSLLHSLNSQLSLTSFSSPQLSLSISPSCHIKLQLLSLSFLLMVTREEPLTFNVTFLMLIAPLQTMMTTFCYSLSLPLSPSLESLKPSDPYNFGYDVRDDFGNHQYRKEEADGRGTVRGTYGYTDANGLFRYVDYIADANGFQAKIRSNEPGIGAGQAASILLTAEEPPRSVLDLPSAPRPTLQRLRSPPRLPENVAFHPIDVHPIASERSERLRYNFPLPSASESNEVASDREEIIYSDEHPPQYYQPPSTSSPSPVTSSPRVYRGERLTSGSLSSSSISTGSRSNTNDGSNN